MFKNELIMGAVDPPLRLCYVMDSYTHPHTPIYITLIEESLTRSLYHNSENLCGVLLMRILRIFFVTHYYNFYF